MRSAMGANPEGPLEYAMTYVPGATGLRQVCSRPDDVVNMAFRLKRWADAPEGCQNCSSHALMVVSGQALCPRCRDQRHVHSGLAEHARVQLSPMPLEGAGFEGHAIVFGKRSLDLGGFQEIIHEGAVNRTLREGYDVRALWNHNSDTPLGRLSAQTLGLRKDSA